MSRGFNPDDYEPVEDRLRAFWAEHPQGRVLTRVIDADGDRCLVMAEVYDDRQDERPSASGLAEELRGQGNVNRTSHVENCETSAIGRALANRGYATKGKRPSREEMAKTARAETPTPPAPTHDPKAVHARLTEWAAGDATNAKSVWEAAKQTWGQDAATRVMSADSLDELVAAIAAKKKVEA